MRAIWTLSVSQLRNNKLKNLFVALIILLSTVMLSVATVVIGNTGNQFDAMHEDTNGSHQLLRMNQGFHDMDFVQSWWSEQAGVQASPLLYNRVLDKMSYNGETIENLFRFIRTPSEPIVVDQPLVVQER
jgi:putative ABC transport system permease protein